MREILFRGKMYNGEWVEGLTLQWCHDLDIQHEKRLFLTPNGYSFPMIVDPETLGQYTGLTDKNGRKIFEGDILKKVLLPTKRIENNFRIAFVSVKSCFFAIDLDGSNVTFISDYINNNYEIEVIGNIFDNPETDRRIK